MDFKYIQKYKYPVKVQISNTTVIYVVVFTSHPPPPPTLPNTTACDSGCDEIKKNINAGFV